MDDLLLKLEDEQKNRFKKPWSKLDKGSKLECLNLFIDNEINKNNLNEFKSELFKKLILNLHDTNSLNKTCDINYCEESCTISNIKNLVYNEKDKTYLYKQPKKKIKISSKSKSNIERHFNRSKDNKKK